MAGRNKFSGKEYHQGVFIPDLVPTNPNSLNKYLEKQFDQIARMLNGRLQGSSIPPTSKYPEGVSDGNIFYFTGAIVRPYDDVVVADRKGLWYYVATRYANGEVATDAQGTWYLLIDMSSMNGITLPDPT